MTGMTSLTSSLVVYCFINLAFGFSLTGKWQTEIEYAGHLTV
jgi:hypothetical protein